MFTRIALAALIVATGPLLAVAQSSTATTGTTNAIPAPPMTSAPTAGQTGQSQTKSPPPAARSGEKGLRTGNDAANGEQLEIKRVK